MQEHQKLVARLAKNDTDDVEEIDGRRIYKIYMSYNVYLRNSLMDHIERNKDIERIYIMLRKISVIDLLTYETQNTNIANIVQKVINKDKNYNNAVSGVTSKEIKIDILKNKKQNLIDELKQLKLSSNVNL